MICSVKRRTETDRQADVGNGGGGWWRDGPSEAGSPPRARSEGGGMVMVSSNETPTSGTYT